MNLETEAAVLMLQIAAEYTRAGCANEPPNNTACTVALRDKFNEVTHAAHDDVFRVLELLAEGQAIEARSDFQKELVKKAADALLTIQQTSGSVDITDMVSEKVYE